MTIIDCCLSLKMVKKNLVVLGVVDMRQLLLIQLQADTGPNVNTRRKHDIENCQCIYVFEVFVKKKVALT